MSEPIQHDIVLREDRTFTLAVACVTEDPDTLEVDVRNLSGWSGAMQVRATGTAAAVLVEASVSIDVPTGVVTATIDPADTLDVTWRSGVYDLVITDGAAIEPIAEGAVRLRQTVTRTA